MLAALVASSAIVVTSLLPWVRTGARERTSYQLLAAARRLDVLTSDAEHVLVVAWRFLPLVVALGWLAFATRRLPLAALASLVTGAGALATAVAVDRAPLLVLPAVRGTMILGGFAAGMAVLSLVALKESP